MRKVRIPKGSGRFRTIYCPSAKEKTRLRAIVPNLATLERQRAMTLRVLHVAHGFVTGRSPVTCAMAHRCYAVTLSCDLSSWFDSVTAQQLLDAGLAPDVVAAITVDGACRQGLPTSPAAANLVATQFDAMLVVLLSGMFGDDFAYTRYADDIAISWNMPTPNSERYVLTSVQGCATTMNWRIAEHKTRVQYASGGKRIVVGIAVDDAIGPTRNTKRRMRAAAKQNNHGQLHGLIEWSKCRTPRITREPGMGRRVAGMDMAGPSPDFTVHSVVTAGTVVETGTRRITFQ